MFWKISFFVQLALIISMAWLFMSASSFKNTGAVSWVDTLSKDRDATVQFLTNAFGLKIASPDAQDTNTASGTQLCSKSQMWPTLRVTDASDKGGMSIPYFTVKDYAHSHKIMLDLGAKPVTTDQYLNSAKFGIYVIPGDVQIGIVQWEHTDKK